MKMNLVTMSLYARRVIAGFIAVLSLYLLSIVLRPTLVSTYNKMFPPKDPPTIKYGILDPLVFTEKPIKGSLGRFKLNTQNGRLPNDLPNKLPVYRLSKPGFSYEAGKNAQKHAAILGFTDDELVTDLKSQTYEWKDKETGSILEIKTQTKEIELITNFIGKDSIFTRSTTASKNRLVSEVKAMLSSINRLTDQTYIREEGEVTFGKVEQGELIKVDSLFEAEIARVDLLRKVYEYPVLGSDPTRGLISVTAKLNGIKEPLASVFPEMSYHEWTVDSDQTGTYPLISVSDAWNAVATEKKGVVVSLVPTNKSVLSKYIGTEVDEVFINKIYLAYYDTPEYQKYLQPIYVFEGDYNIGNNPGGKIVFYFPAIQANYIKQVTPTQTTQE